MTGMWFYFVFFGVAVLGAHQWNRVHQFFAWLFGVLAIMFVAHTAFGDRFTGAGSIVADAITNTAKALWGAIQHMV